MSWVAVKGGTPQAVHDALDLRSTGIREEIPESEITGAKLREGWYMVVSNRDELRLTDDNTLKRLSRVGETIMCFVEEHVMCSFAACWQGETLVWSIFHDSASGIESLEIKGHPPAPFEAIRDRLRSEQARAGGKNAGVDYIFDIPVELAESLTGYRHDKVIPGIAKDAFEVLTSARRERQSWWRRILNMS